MMEDAIRSLNQKSKSSKIFNFSLNIVLLFLSSFLFALQNPSMFFSEGLAWVAWFAYVPLFVLISRISLKTSWIYGFFYGILCYCFYVSWLVTFHPLGIFAVSLEHAFMLLFVFFFLRLAIILFPKNG